MTHFDVPRFVPDSGGSLLIGREREQAALRAILNEVIEGRGHPVLIGGEAGIGKSTLLAWLASEAERSGVQIGSGGCYDLT